MSLGKRARPPHFRRTISLTEFSPDIYLSDPISDPDPNPAPSSSSYLHRHPHPIERQRAATVPEEPSPPPPPTPKEEVVGVVDVTAVQAPEFLRACGICNCSLGAGRDTFIYMGEAGFCSLECREKQIKLDARKDKCLQLSKKSKAPPPKAGTEGDGSNKTASAG